MKHYDLVLVGGGHTHVLLIKALAMKPIKGVRVSLVSEKTLTPYSGMLPGFVSGHYSLEQTNIDLNQLCRKAGVRWINARATSVDPDRKRMSLDGCADIEFDALSIDIGSTPDQSIKGAGEFATGVKPITGFQSKWHALQKLSEHESTRENSTQNWGVIGAGAGGVELVLAMAYRLESASYLRFHLIFRGQTILQGYPNKVIKTVEKKLRELNVSLHPNFSVTEVSDYGVHGVDNQLLELNQSIWCTGAMGASWLADSTLQTTDRNFIEVEDTLQSVSHSHIFAVGDIAEMKSDPRPKAGVFAVRQAPWLEENLRCYFSDKPLQKIELQSNFLSMLALGEKSAVANRNGLTVSGKWVWRWKDSIDQKFMHQFSEMPMQMPLEQDKSNDDNAMHCAGCASKLGPNILKSNLAQINGAELGSIEDASLWQPKADYALVQSIDGFRSFTSDDYRFARICVNHALSDINAMGASPTHAQAWVNLNFNHARLQQRDHLRMLQAITDGLQEQGARLSGGHSSEGVESHLGIVANGELAHDTHWPKSGAKPGDVLLLSKPLGTGVILAADQQGMADADAVDAAYKSMLSSNYASAEQLRTIKPNAVTDITGFGLIGHLLEMLDEASQGLYKNISAQLSLASIPLILGARELSSAGWRSSLYPQLASYLQRCHFASELDSPTLDLLLDPQTSGGLLASVSPDTAKLILDRSSKFVAIGNISTIADKEPCIKVIK